MDSCCVGLNSLFTDVDVAFLVDSEKKSTRFIDGKDSLRRIWEEIDPRLSDAMRLDLFFNEIIDTKDFGMFRQKYALFLSSEPEKQKCMKFRCKLCFRGEKGIFLVSFMRIKDNPCCFVLSLERMDEFLKDLPHEFADNVPDSQIWIKNFALGKFICFKYIDIRDCSQITVKSPGAQYETESGNYLDSLSAYIADNLHPDDVSRATLCIHPEHIRDYFKSHDDFADVFKFFLPDKSIGYLRLNITKGADDNHAVISFLDISKEYLEQFRKSKILSSLMSDYEALFVTEKDKNSIIPINVNEDFNKLMGFLDFGSKKLKPISYAEWLEIISEALVIVQDRAGFVNFVQNYDSFDMSESVSYSFKGLYKGHINHFLIKYFRLEDVSDKVIIAIKNDENDYKNRQIAIEKEEKHLQYMSIIEELGRDFEYIDYVSLCEDKAQDYSTMYRSSYLLSRMIPGWGQEIPFSQRLDLIRDYLVCEEDREEFYKHTRREYILANLHNEISYYVDFRANIAGKYQYFQLKFVRVTDTKGRVSAYVVGLLKFDEENRKMIALQERIREASQAKTEFLFNMSHDIRTPLNAILGFTDIALSKVNSADVVKDSLDKIKSSGDLLLKIINDILDMSRIESGTIVLNEEEHDVLLSFNDLKPSIMMMAKEKNIIIDFNIHRITNRYVYADTVRIERVFVNIICNAIKYTESGGRIRVNLCEIPSSRKGYGMYKFTCSDTGIGMSEEFVGHAFDEFAREENATVNGVVGTGLGLSVCKAITNLMSGKIYCRSVKGVGSTFTVELPLKLRTAEEKVGVTDITPGAKLMDFNGKRVLLAEDNELNREIFVNMLIKYGMTVDEAVNGAEALTKVTDNGPMYYDFVLMDIQMPVMNGYEATKEIRKRFGGSELPIFALSANAFVEDRAKSLEVGMNGHFSKPVIPNKFIEELSSYFESLND